MAPKQKPIFWQHNFYLCGDIIIIKEIFSSTPCVYDPTHWFYDRTQNQHDLFKAHECINMDYFGGSP